MKTNLESVSTLERKLNIQVPAAEVQEAFDRAFKGIQRHVAVKGFRKGKVPTKVIDQRFGQQVRAEAYGDLVRMTFGEAVREKNLQPAGTPNIEAGKNGEDGEISFSARWQNNTWHICTR